MLSSHAVQKRYSLSINAVSLSVSHPRLIVQKLQLQVQTGQSPGKPEMSGNLGVVRENVCQLPRVLFLTQNMQ